MLTGYIKIYLVIKGVVMEDKFIGFIDYLDELQNELQDGINNDNLSSEDLLLLIIKYATLRNKFFEGSIILTKEENYYRVSNIQKHSYAWFLVDKVIDIDYVMYMLNELGIVSELEHYIVSDHMNDYELSFSLPRLKKRIKIK